MKASTVRCQVECYESANALGETEGGDPHLEGWPSMLDVKSRSDYLFVEVLPQL